MYAVLLAFHDDDHDVDQREKRKIQGIVLLLASLLGYFIVG